MSIAPHRIADHPAPPREQRRGEIRDRLLDSLEALVLRHRALTSGDTADLHAELIAAELAYELAGVRSELRRAPRVGG